MNTADLYDLIVVIIILIFAIRGYQKGLVNQLGAIISMIVGVVVSVHFTPMLSPYLFGNDNVRYISAFVILIFVATLVIWEIINAISAFITKLKLNFWNNQMGALVGLAYGFLWTMVLTFILLIFAVPSPTIVVDENGKPVENMASNEQSFIMASKTGPFLTKTTLVIIDLLPQGGEDYRLYDYLREYLQRNANGIKESNPDLSSEAFSLSGPGKTSSEEDEKPSLPLPSVLPMPEN